MDAVVKKTAKAEAVENLGKWNGVKKQIAALQLKRQKAMEPLIQKHAEEMSAATASLDSKIAALELKAAPLYSAVKDFLDSQKRPLSLECEGAVASLAIFTKKGARECSSKAFYDLALKLEKDPFAALKVEIAKAEKLVGASELDTIAKPKEKEVREISIKEAA